MAMTYEQAMEFIHSTDWLGSKPGLERITELLNRIGNPHKGIKAVHVAGTNGKGSFCSMLDSVLSCAGYKTGLFTSPYIEFFEERICFCGEMISKQSLSEITELVSSACKEMSSHPTEFEIITAIGFEYFKRKNVDIAIIECGLGGRLDSTNVIEKPILSVITGIALDHVAVLGNTISEIAGEKAGIIKPHCPVLYGGESDGEAEPVIYNRANELCCPYIKTNRAAITDDRYSDSGAVFSYGDYSSLSISLTGVYQPLNAANVIEAVKLLRTCGYEISDSALYDGLKNAKWKGRFEKLSSCPPVFFDGGHNLEGVTSAVCTVNEYFKGNKITVISGVMRDKDYHQIAKKICTAADKIITVTPDNPRALPAAEYAKVFSGLGVNAVEAASFDEAIKLALKHSENKPILCLGSLYSYSDFKNALKSAKNNQVKKKKRLAVIFASILALILLLTILWQGGVFDSLFTEKKTFTYPPVHLYPVDYKEDIFRDAEFLSLDRRIFYIDGNESRLISDPDDAVGYNVAQFFLRYFEAITLGDADGYSSMFTDSYRSRYPDKERFTMQKIYDITVERDFGINGEEAPDGVICHRFKVSYKIHENNGSFKNDLASDTQRPQIYRLYQYSNGDILINSISDIIVK